MRSFDVSVKREARLLDLSSDNRDEERKLKEQLKLRKRIIKDYAMFVKRAKRVPTFSELGHSSKVIKDIFNSKEELDRVARKLQPTKFKGVIDQIYLVSNDIVKRKMQNY
jgi:hypothetical protein